MLPFNQIYSTLDSKQMDQFIGQCTHGKILQIYTAWGMDN